MNIKIKEAKSYVEKIDKKVDKEIDTLKICKKISYLLLMLEVILTSIFTFLAFNIYNLSLIFAFISATLLVISVIHGLLIISELLKVKKGFPILKKLIIKCFKNKKYQELNQYLKENSLKEGILRVIKEQPQQLLISPLFNEMNLLKKIYGEETINLIIKKA